MRKSKRDKKVKKVFNATTEKMKELITNENEIKDKKDIRYIKTLMTKLEKLFSWQYNLIETGEDGLI